MVQAAITKLTPAASLPGSGSAEEVRIQRSGNLALIHVNALAAGADSFVR
jgi:hypothetical protein